MAFWCGCGSSVLDCAGCLKLRMDTLERVIVKGSNDLLYISNCLSEITGQMKHGRANPSLGFYGDETLLV